jgi:hypothetical protein
MIIIPIGLPELNEKIIRAAQSKIPILESPPLSNRSPEIDAMCRKFGVPLGSYWCALFAADVWTDAGAEIVLSAHSRQDSARPRCTATAATSRPSTSARRSRASSRS